MEWSSLNKKQQQTIIRLGLLALLGVALLLAGGRGSTTATPEMTSLAEATQSAAAVQQSTGTVAALEQQLADTLSQVQGAGTVTVQLTVHNLGRKEYVRDIQKTERSSSEQNGDSRQQTTELQETQTVVQQAGSQSGNQPLLVEETMPEIAGVLIVATGAEQAVVQERLLQAAATVLQVSSEKIMVLPGEGGALRE